MLIMFQLVFTLAFITCFQAAHPHPAGLCRNNEHINGSWVEHSVNSSKKAFYCCGKNGMSIAREQDAQQCGSSFTPVISRTFRGSNEFNTQIGDDACSCDIVQNTRSTISKRERYHWQPTHCNLLRWNSSQFCDLLGSRKLLLLGDSTMEQVAATVMSMITTGKGGCAGQVIYGRTYYLAFNHIGDTNFKEIVAEVKPDICVMTTGAHLGDLGDLYSILGAIKPSLLEFRTRYNVTFVWKSQAPGHPDCDKTDAPLNPLSKPYIPEKKWYNWELFSEFDRAAKAYAAELNMPVMDMSPLNYRPDAHIGWHAGLPGGPRNIDCLHYCAPGPLDLFAVQLLTMLHTREI